MLSFVTFLFLGKKFVKCAVLDLFNLKFLLPNFVVEWLTLLLRIREVPRSNLGPETGYPD
jgi:hypothetical protein